MELESITDELVDAVKYMNEYYEDAIHCYGHVILYNFFVPDPYNIIISYKKEQDRDQSSKIFVRGAQVPQNKYHLGYTGNKKESELYKVKISKKWVEDCQHLLNLEG